MCDAVDLKEKYFMSLNQLQNRVALCWVWENMRVVCPCQCRLSC